MIYREVRWLLSGNFRHRMFCSQLRATAKPFLPALKMESCIVVRSLVSLEGKILLSAQLVHRALSYRTFIEKVRPWFQSIPSVARLAWVTSGSISPRQRVRLTHFYHSSSSSIIIIILRSSLHSAEGRWHSETGVRLSVVQHQRGSEWQHLLRRQDVYPSKPGIQ